MTANCLDSTESNNTNTCGESISSLFIRACGIGPKDALKTSAAPAPPQARRTRPSHKQAPPYAHYLARAAGRKARRVPSNARARVEQAGLHWRVSHWQNGNSAWAWWAGSVPLTPHSDLAQSQCGQHRRKTEWHVTHQAWCTNLGHFL